MPTVLFPFLEYWGYYIGFLTFILGMLALDLGIINRTSKVMGWKAALGWSVAWILLAIAFNVGLYLYSLNHFDTITAKRLGLEFLTGYLVEKSLAVDNIFVFVLVFAFFGIPEKYQHRVLFYGILGALVFRILFIALSSVLMKYHIVVVLFGIFLIITGIKVIFAKDKPLDPNNNILIKTLKKFLPVTPNLVGDKFLTREQGKWFATPLFIALIFLEASDIVFAVDSVPAIFAITNEPFLVLTSNVFAILGLRSMYFLLAGAVKKLRYLKYGLGTILVFVGLKMSWLNILFDGKFPTLWSLGVIVFILTLTVVVSLAFPAEKALGEGEKLS